MRRVCFVFEAAVFCKGAKCVFGGGEGVLKANAFGARNPQAPADERGDPLYLRENVLEESFQTLFRMACVRAVYNIVC